MHDDESRDLKDFVKQLVTMGHLDGKVLGVAKQLIGKGEQSLTRKQWNVLQYNVIDKYSIRCKVCDTELHWGEIGRAYFDDKMCDRCSNAIERPV